MKRPLSDFFSPFDIDRMYMLSSTVSGLCFACEEPIGASHFRVSNAANSTTAIVCCPCARPLQMEVVKSRLTRQQRNRPHFTPEPTVKSDNKKDTWQKPHFDLGEE